MSKACAPRFVFPQVGLRDEGDARTPINVIPRASGLGRMAGLLECGDYPVDFVGVKVRGVALGKASILDLFDHELHLSLEGLVIMMEPIKHLLDLTLMLT